MERTVRYALIDLQNRTTGLKEVQAGWFGTWGLLLEELGFWWRLDPSAVALTTGPLTGCGAPGTGAMTWSYLKNGRVQNLTGEGRLGAALRYAGVDALLFYGRSDAPLWLEVEDGKLSLREGKPSYTTLAAGKPSEDTVVVTFRPRGAVEDKYFPLSDGALSRRLLEKGISALTVDTAGGLAVADSQRLAALCVDLYHWAAQNGPAAGSRQQPAQFLSLDHTVGFESPATYLNPARSPEEQLFAALGILWSPRLEGRSRRADTAALLEACLGIPCTEGDLDALEAHLAQLRQRNLEGGDQ